MAPSEYEEREAIKVLEHKEKVLNRSPRRFVPQAVKQRGAGLYERVKKVPGADLAKDSGANMFNSVAAGAGKMMMRTGQISTSRDRVVRAYQKKGHTVRELSDIQLLDLKEIDKTASFTRLHYTYSLTAAAEGAAAGLAVGGGQALAVGGIAGAGVAAAPGLGTIATAMGVDAAALLTACSRVVAHDALYYGYDPLDPAEEVFMMQVIGLGMATTASAKLAAYQQLALLTRSLAINAVWKELNKQTLVKITQRFAAQFGQKLTKKKLGQFVPVAGIGIGAALNWKMVDDIAEAAYWAYRERFLLEKGVASLSVDVKADSDDFEGARDVGDSNESVIDLIEILDSEGITVEEDPV